NLDESHRIASAFAEVDIHHSVTFKTQAGINFTNKAIDHGQETISPFKDESFVRPYVNFQIGNSLSEWLLELGGEVNYSFDGFSDPASAYPGYRANLQWRINNAFEASIGARHAAGQNIQTFGRIESYNQPLIIDKYEFSLDYTNHKHSFSFTPYLQEIKYLPVFFIPTGFIHLADQSDPIISSAFLSGNTQGKGRYYGLELDWKMRSENGWKIGANQTVYTSIRSGPENEFENSKYDGQYASHLIIAKEIYKVRKEKNRIWNFSLRGMLNGGIRAQTIDTDASQEFERTVFSNPGGYHERLPAYKRVDASISRTIANEKAKWRIALDIQNVLNMSNVAFEYYDPFLQRIEVQEQLGIIPVFSVQVSW
ncbi:MAG TPA: hypothetical protein VMZ69_11060, partial [Saprospiraceae bacterium]|nr:hypothetical protein [Saprospiraceae bacterium]